MGEGERIAGELRALVEGVGHERRMRVDFRVVAPVALGVLLGLCGVTAAQDADRDAFGYLSRIDAASVSAPPFPADFDYSGDEIPIGERRVCLNTDRYVLAVQIYDGRVNAAAALYSDAGEAGGETVAQASVLANQSTEPGRWNWSSFAVEEPECFRVRVIGGRARVYRLMVLIDW